MGWTWAQLQATPLYVRRYTWDFINLRATAEKAANEKAAKKQR